MDAARSSNSSEQTYNPKWLISQNITISGTEVLFTTWNVRGLITTN
jgi:hypothetical protein